ncbi:DUF4410 domain-containing protein [Falsiroseomonas sp. HC035]|uniref:DUF4410 domain-containing protein n=1 Tax=Falsiroseomonas sp. HC035 TaxID=3390999 RepID=UPI003D31CB02
MTRSAALFLPLSVLLLLGACAQARVGALPAASTTAAPALPLPRPVQVVVEPFRLDPAMVTLDAAPLLRVRRMVDGNDAAARQASAAEAVAGFQTALVAALRERGFAAVPSGHESPAMPRLVVRGDFSALEEGNRARRAVVGFGLGASRVAGRARLDWQDGVDSQSVDGFALDADSGRLPGGLIGVGGGARAVAVGVALRGALSETRGPQEIGTLAEGAAARITAFAEAQGWTTVSLAPRGRRAPDRPRSVMLPADLRQ